MTKLVLSLLEEDPEKRPTASDALVTLNKISLRPTSGQHDTQNNRFSFSDMYKYLESRVVEMAPKPMKEFVNGTDMHKSYAPPSYRTHMIHENPSLGGDILNFVVENQTMRRLKIVKRIGVGGIGDIFLADDITVARPKPLQVAIKRITIGADMLELIEEASHIARGLGRICPYTVSLYESYYLEDKLLGKCTLYLIMVCILCFTKFRNIMNMEH